MEKIKDTINYITIVLLMTLAALFGATGAASQTLKNYKGEIVYEEVKDVDKATSYTYTDKDGKSYSVYITKKGKYYINKISKKTNKPYKYYLPEKYQKALQEQGESYKN